MTKYLILLVAVILFSCADDEDKARASFDGNWDLYVDSNYSPSKIETKDNTMTIWGEKYTGDYSLSSFTGTRVINSQGLTTTFTLFLYLMNDNEISGSFKVDMSYSGENSHSSVIVTGRRK